MCSCRGDIDVGSLRHCCHELKVWLAGLAILLAVLATAPARGANINNPAVPVTSLLTVQPIVVCQGSGTVSGTPGTGCAPSSGLAAYETYTNTILDQAGIGVAFAAPEYLDNSAYLSVDADTTTSSLFDTAHNLLDLPGHGQSTQPDTLNVYLVNNIISTTNGTPNGSGIYGFGLIGGNGAIVATAPNSLGRTAAVDTMAHELGHNLGLNHTDAAPYASTAVNTPYNLMNSNTRVVPFETCQVAPYSCAPPKGDVLAPLKTAAASTSGKTTLSMASSTGVVAGMVATGTGIPANDTVLSVTGNTVTLAAPLSAAVGSGASIGFASPPETDQLLGPAAAANEPTVIDNQIGTLQAPPIFTELPNVALHQGATPYGGTEFLSFLAANQTPLTAVSFRFQNTALHVQPNPGGLATATSQVIGSNVEWNATFTPPVNAPASGQFLVGVTNFGANYQAYSSQYTFGNGIASRAGYDVTGDSDSLDGAVFTFDPDTPGLPTGASYLPAGYGAISPVTGQPVQDDTDGAWSTPDVVDATLLPFEALDRGAAVPEPASLALLGTAFGGVMMRRWRGSLRRPAGAAEKAAA